MKVPGARKLRTEIYDDAEADSMLSWVGDQPGKRARVGYSVLATLRWTGLRRNAISMLRLEDVDLKARRISLVGKEDKARIVPNASPLADYMTSQHPTLAKSPFVFINPSGQHTAGPTRDATGP
jgi:integrase